MKYLFVAAALGLACTACQPTGPAHAPAQTGPTTEQPGASAPSRSNGKDAKASPPPVQPAMAEAGDLVPGIPSCKAGDHRTPIPVWKPTVDAQNKVSSAPPQQSDQVVVLALESHDNPKCNDKDLNTFSFSKDSGASGGLEIGVRGNSQEVEGICHLSGLYRTETTADPHQSQASTHFSAVDASEIASANTYCIQQS